MRIAYICQSYPPMVSGAAIVVKRLAKEMNSRGHTVLVISASDKRHSEICQLEGFRHVKLRAVKNPLRVGQTFTLWPSKQIHTHLSQFTPDIVHLHDPLNLGLLALKCAQAMEIPVILTIHQLPIFIAAHFPDISVICGIVEKLLWSYGDWLLHQCACTIVPTQTIAKKVRLHTHDRPEVISNGIDLRLFSPVPEVAGERQYLYEKYAVDPLKPILLHVGRLDADKNVSTFIRAAACALDQVNAHMLVVGDGCQRQELEELCSELDIRERVHFLGYIDQEGDLPALYRRATVFAMASEIETQGIVILEALASGVPVVAFNATCMHELIRDSVNGFLVPPGDEDAMGNRLAGLLSSPAHASKMGRAGRELVKEHAIEKTITNYEQLYREVLRNRRMYDGCLQHVSPN